MLTTWYTDPSGGDFEEGSGKFSSYYQYDTVTLKLVRIRLELGRESVPNGDSGATQVILDEERAVGFSPEDIVDNTTSYPNEAFSTNDGSLCLYGQPMSQTPSDGSWIVDMSSGDAQPHFGNQVTLNPNLPEGIQTKHLSLLANQAIIDGQGCVLTGNSATAAELSQELQQQVADIVGKPFDQITDDDLLAKLQEQVTAIREELTEVDENTVIASLDTVDSLVDQINDDIANDAFTPDETVNDAFNSYQAALATVDDAVNDSTRTAAIENLQAAHDALVNAFEQDEAQQMDAYQQNIDDANQAIETARQASQRMDAITVEYESAEQAESIQEYEDSMKSYDTSSAAEEAV